DDATSEAATGPS
uniref:Polysialoglycoprotein repeating unit n=2 Tax=Salvelinus TaxID=8033 RepID=Q7LZ41_SALLE